MNKTKDILITGFALFSMFFGAGNLILPPFLGVQAGESWLLVTLGFITTAVVIPILAIIAHARLQGTLFDFAKKISPIFSTIYCLIIYVISVLLPAPRTASVTHEMSIAPYFDVSSVTTSTVYFVFVLLFALNRTKILSVLGRFLTPIIVLILLVIIIVGIGISPENINTSLLEKPFISGVLEGYQTFDAIGGAVVGGVIVISLRLKGFRSYVVTRSLISKAGLLAGLGLLIIYAGLIALGAYFNSEIPVEATRTDLLIQLSETTLGRFGTVFLSVLVALACFTTAVGITIGVADYFRGFFNNSNLAYQITAIISCIFGVLVGQFDVSYIINIAIPVLMIAYPVTIVLILLNVLPRGLTRVRVFRSVVLMAIIFSIPDALNVIFSTSEFVKTMVSYIPLAEYSLGWVLPCFLTFISFNMFRKKRSVYR